MSRKHLLRVISALLIVAFGASDLAWAAPIDSTPPALLWQKIVQDPSFFEAPIEFVNLREVRKGSKDTLIIHIQDAHSNYSGQQNLASALDDIMRRYDVSLVLSEGGISDCSLTPLKKMAPPEVWQKVAKSYLIQGKITGEEYLNLVSDRPMKIIGIEDLPLYVKSVENYGKLADGRPAILQYLKQIQNVVDKLKRKSYPESLQKYEEKKAASAVDGEISFDAQFTAMQALAEKNKIPMDEFANLKMLGELKAKESKIDFNIANLEQASFVDEISKRGGAQELRDRLARMKANKGSALSQYAYFQNMIEVARSAGVSTDKHPNLMGYGAYLADFSKINLEGVLDELARGEDKIFKTLLEDQDLRTIRAIDRHLGLLRTAYEIRMSTQDFRQFEANEPDFTTERYLAFVNRKLAETGYAEDLIAYDPVIERGREALKAFYESVTQRDFAFLENVGKTLEREKQKVAVMIAGGYHTPHLVELFGKEGYSYAVLTPIVTSETNQQKYEKMLLSPVRKEVRKLESVQGEKKADKSLSALEGDLARKKPGENGVRVAEARVRDILDTIVQLQNSGKIGVKDIPTAAVNDTVFDLLMSAGVNEAEARATAQEMVQRLLQEYGLVEASPVTPARSEVPAGTAAETPMVLAAARPVAAEKALPPTEEYHLKPAEQVALDIAARVNADPLLRTLRGIDGMPWSLRRLFPDARRTDHRLLHYLTRALTAYTEHVASTEAETASEAEFIHFLRNQYSRSDAEKMQNLYSGLCGEIRTFLNTGFRELYFDGNHMRPEFFLGRQAGGSLTASEDAWQMIEKFFTDPQQGVPAERLREGAPNPYTLREALSVIRGPLRERRAGLPSTALRGMARRMAKALDAGLGYPADVVSTYDLALLVKQRPMFVDFLESRLLKAPHSQEGAPEAGARLATVQEMAEQILSPSTLEQSFDVYDRVIGPALDLAPAKKEELVRALVADRRTPEYDQVLPTLFNVNSVFQQQVRDPRIALDGLTHPYWCIRDFAAYQLNTVLENGYTLRPADAARLRAQAAAEPDESIRYKLHRAMALAGDIDEAIPFLVEAWRKGVYDVDVRLVQFFPSPRLIEPLLGLAAEKKQELNKNIMLCVALILHSYPTEEQRALDLYLPQTMPIAPDQDAVAALEGAPEGQVFRFDERFTPAQVAEILGRFVDRDVEVMIARSLWGEGNRPVIFAMRGAETRVSIPLFTFRDFVIAHNHPKGLKPYPSVLSKGDVGFVKLFKNQLGESLVTAYAVQRDPANQKRLLARYDANVGDFSTAKPIRGVKVVSEAAVGAPAFDKALADIFPAAARMAAQETEAQDAELIKQFDALNAEARDLAQKAQEAAAKGDYKTAWANLDRAIAIEKRIIYEVWGELDQNDARDRAFDQTSQQILEALGALNQTVEDAIAVAPSKQAAFRLVDAWEAAQGKKTGRSQAARRNLGENVPAEAAQAMPTAPALTDYAVLQSTGSPAVAWVVQANTPETTDYVKFGVNSKENLKREALLFSAILAEKPRVAQHLPKFKGYREELGGEGADHVIGRIAKSPRKETLQTKNYMVTQQAPGEDLYKFGERARAGNVGEREVLDWLVKIADVIVDFHAEGVIHRDLKPSAIFLDPETGKVTVIDLGFSIIEGNPAFSLESLGDDYSGFGGPHYSGFSSPRNRDVRAVYMMAVELLEALQQAGKAGEVVAKLDALLSRFDPTIAEDIQALSEALKEIQRSLPPQAARLATEKELLKQFDALNAEARDLAQKAQEAAAKGDYKTAWANLDRAIAIEKRIIYEVWGELDQNDARDRAFDQTSQQILEALGALNQTVEDAIAAAPSKQEAFRLVDAWEAAQGKKTGRSQAARDSLGEGLPAQAAETPSQAFERRSAEVLDLATRQVQEAVTRGDYQKAWEIWNQAFNKLTAMSAVLDESGQLLEAYEEVSRGVFESQRVLLGNIEKAINTALAANQTAKARAILDAWKAGNPGVEGKQDTIYSVLEQKVLAAEAGVILARHSPTPVPATPPIVFGASPSGNSAAVKMEMVDVEEAAPRPRSAGRGRASYNPLTNRLSFTYPPNTPLRIEGSNGFEISLSQLAVIPGVKLSRDALNKLVVRLPAGYSFILPGADAENPVKGRTLSLSLPSNTPAPGASKGKIKVSFRTPKSAAKPVSEAPPAILPFEEVPVMEVFIPKAAPKGPPMSGNLKALAGVYPRLLRQILEKARAEALGASKPVEEKYWNLFRGAGNWGIIEFNPALPGETPTQKRFSDEMRKWILEHVVDDGETAATYSETPVVPTEKPAAPPLATAAARMAGVDDPEQVTKFNNLNAEAREWVRLAQLDVDNGNYTAAWAKYNQALEVERQASDVWGEMYENVERDKAFDETSKQILNLLGLINDRLEAAVDAALATNPQAALRIVNEWEAARGAKTGRSDAKRRQAEAAISETPPKAPTANDAVLKLEGWWEQERNQTLGNKRNKALIDLLLGDFTLEEAVLIQQTDKGVRILLVTGSNGVQFLLFLDKKNEVLGIGVDRKLEEIPDARRFLQLFPEELLERFPAKYDAFLSRVLGPVVGDAKGTAGLSASVKDGREAFKGFSITLPIVNPMRDRSALYRQVRSNPVLAHLLGLTVERSEVGGLGRAMQTLNEENPENRYTAAAHRDGLGIQQKLTDEPGIVPLPQEIFHKLFERMGSAQATRLIDYFRGRLKLIQTIEEMSERYANLPLSEKVNEIVGHILDDAADLLRDPELKGLLYMPYNAQDIDFLVEMGFLPAEVAPILKDAATGARLATDPVIQTRPAQAREVRAERLKLEKAAKALADFDASEKPNLQTKLAFIAYAIKNLGFQNPDNVWKRLTGLKADALNAPGPKSFLTPTTLKALEQYMNRAFPKSRIAGTRDYSILEGMKIQAMVDEFKSTATIRAGKQEKVLQRTGFVLYLLSAYGIRDEDRALKRFVRIKRDKKGKETGREPLFKPQDPTKSAYAQFLTPRMVSLIQRYEVYKATTGQSQQETQRRIKALQRLATGVLNTGEKFQNELFRVTLNVGGKPLVLDVLKMKPTKKPVIVESEPQAKILKMPRQEDVPEDIAAARMATEAAPVDDAELLRQFAELNKEARGLVQKAREAAARGDYDVAWQLLNEARAVERRIVYEVWGEMGQDDERDRFLDDTSRQITDTHGEMNQMLEDLIRAAPSRQEALRLVDAWEAAQGKQTGRSDKARRTLAENVPFAPPVTDYGDLKAPDVPMVAWTVQAQTADLTDFFKFGVNSTENLKREAELFTKVLSERPRAAKHLPGFKGYREEVGEAGADYVKDKVAKSPKKEKLQTKNYLVTEKAPGEDTNKLKARAGAKDDPLSDREVLDWVVRIAEAVEDLHADGVIHRDLKPSGIFLDPITGKVTLIDLGFSILEGDAKFSLESLGGYGQFGVPWYSGYGTPRNRDVRAVFMIALELLEALQESGKAGQAAAKLDAALDRFDPRTAEDIGALTVALKEAQKSLAQGARLAPVSDATAGARLTDADPATAGVGLGARMAALEGPHTSDPGMMIADRIMLDKKYIGTGDYEFFRIDLRDGRYVYLKDSPNGMRVYLTRETTLPSNVGPDIVLNPVGVPARPVLVIGSKPQWWRGLARLWRGRPAGEVRLEVTGSGIIGAYETLQVEPGSALITFTNLLPVAKISLEAYRVRPSEDLEKFVKDLAAKQLLGEGEMAQQILWDLELVLSSLSAETMVADKPTLDFLKSFMRDREKGKIVDELRARLLKIIREDLAREKPRVAGQAKAERTLYDVLEVSTDVSPQELAQAYKKKALLHHPDRNPGDDSAPNRFKEVAEAYAVLGDPQARQRYDRLREGLHGARLATTTAQPYGDQRREEPRIDSYLGQFGARLAEKRLSDITRVLLSQDEYGLLKRLAIALVSQREAGFKPIQFFDEHTMIRFERGRGADSNAAIVSFAFLDEERALAQESGAEPPYIVFAQHKITAEELSAARQRPIDVEATVETILRAAALQAVKSTQQSALIAQRARKQLLTEFGQMFDDRSIVGHVINLDDRMRGKPKEYRNVLLLEFTQMKTDRNLLGPVKLFFATNDPELNQVFRFLNDAADPNEDIRYIYSGDESTKPDAIPRLVAQALGFKPEKAESLRVGFSPVDGNLTGDQQLNVIAERASLMYQDMFARLDTTKLARVPDRLRQVMQNLLGPEAQLRPELISPETIRALQDVKNELPAGITYFDLAIKAIEKLDLDLFVDYIKMAVKAIGAAA